MTRPIQLDVKGYAEFDLERKNRFLLSREWNPRLPKVGFCLTNPSDAGEDRDDPTSLKCQTYARLWGYGGILMVNGFSWCATNPRQLHIRDESPETVERNFEAIFQAATDSVLFICGWGRAGSIDSRSKYVLPRNPKWHGTRKGSFVQIIRLKTLGGKSEIAFSIHGGKFGYAVTVADAIDQINRLILRGRNREAL